MTRIYYKSNSFSIKDSLSGWFWLLSCSLWLQNNQNCWNQAFWECVWNQLEEPPKDILHFQCIKM